MESEVHAVAAPGVSDATRRRSRRMLHWLLVPTLVAADAALGHGFPLGLAYMLLVGHAALVLSRTEAVATALIATAARALFGPVGDPLGIEQLIIQLPDPLELPVNIVLSLAAFVSAGVFVAQERRIRELAEAADTDALTGLGNRRAFEKFLKTWLGRRGAVVAIDVDHFKRVNDTHGHGAGDAVLRELAQRLLREVRTSDYCARVGGEEFMIVLPGVDAAAARDVADRIRTSVEKELFALEGAQLRMTVSLGVATGGIDDTLLLAADAALYDAKRAGRNRVCVAVVPSTPAPFAPATTTR